MTETNVYNATLSAPQIHFERNDGSRVVTVSTGPLDSGRYALVDPDAQVSSSEQLPLIGPWTPIPPNSQITLPLGTVRLEPIKGSLGLVAR